VTYLLAALAASAALYQILAILASLRQLRRRPAPAPFSGGVSILKPVRGLDPHFYTAIRSHALQDYGEFELLFGSPAWTIRRWARFAGCRSNFPRFRFR
jgi:hypothetical protein